MITLTQQLEQGRLGSIILVLWHFTYSDDKDDVENEGQVFYIILFLGMILLDTIGV